MTRPFALLAVALATLAACAGESGWTLKRQNENPRLFAIADTAWSTLNVRNLVLSCEEVEGRKSLQLQAYPTSPGPLLPVGATRDQLKDDPRVEIVIDGKSYPANLYFGDDYAVLADGLDGMFPFLSAAPAEAMEKGRTMLLRFDLLRERTGRTAAFDGEFSIDLTAGDSRAAIAAVRRGCAP